MKANVNNSTILIAASISKISAASFLVLTLLAMAACTNNQNSLERHVPGQTDKTSEVKAPAMDIHTAVVIGDLDVIKKHIEAGSDLNVREPAVASSPLISASVFGKTEIAHALIEAGADVNLQNNEGSSALHTAAFLCRTEIVTMLLENGSDKYLRNVYGSTPYESVTGPFTEVKAIYEQFNRDLGPLGLKLDIDRIEATRPVIAELLQDK